MAAEPGNASGIVALVRRCGGEGRCTTLLERIRWPDGPACCRCGSKKAYKIRSRRLYECGDCRHHYSVTSDTILHKTKLPLVKWVIAAALICHARKGISAKQLSRDLGVTYKVAWAMGHKLRTAMRSDQFNAMPFDRVVEVDESYVGGRSRGGKRGRGAPNKVIVFGAKDRHSGEVRLHVIPDVRTRTLRRMVHRLVRTDARLLIADQYAGYDALAREFRLRRINHKKSYTENGVHTQGIESTWAVLKRQYHGTHHWISPKYLPLYLAEIMFRMNNRTDGPHSYRRLLRNALKIRSTLFVRRDDDSCVCRTDGMLLGCCSEVAGHCPVSS